MIIHAFADWLCPTLPITPREIDAMPRAGVNTDYVVRIAKKSISGKESYPVVVDEIPDLSRRKPGVVNVVLGYSITELSYRSRRRGGRDAQTGRRWEASSPPSSQFGTQVVRHSE